MEIPEQRPTPGPTTTAEAQLWHSAASTMPFGIVLVDPDARTLYRDVEAKFGAESLNQRILLDRAIATLLHDPAARDDVERTVELFGPPRRTFLVRRTWLDDRGQLILVEDVSELRRLESVRRDFVANVSHELKTPVGAIVLLAEALAQEDEPTTARRLIQRIVDEGDRLARLVSDLLDLSRIEEGSGVVLAEFDARALVEAVRERFDETARRAELSLRGLVPTAPTMVVADRWQLESALANLVDNAIKYSEPGGTVEISLDASDDTIVLAVRDEGIGIPARDRERIFERFYRVDAARSRATGGTGLGLSIVRHVVENHRGRLNVTSMEGVGSTFELALPRGGPDDGR